jgi:hypothetical protein
VSDFVSPFAGEPQADLEPELPPQVVRGRRSARPFALAAAAAVALLGGTVWAGAVIATHWDIGILAWFVGAATGSVLVRVAGGAVGVGERLAAGLLAAGAIVVGKYAIFVHSVRAHWGALLAQEGVRVHYLDGRQLSIFVHHFGEIVRPVYALWVGLAFVGALRVAAGRPAFGRRRRP